MGVHHHTSMQLTMDEARQLFPWHFDDKTGKAQKGAKIPKYPDGLQLMVESVALKKMGLTPKDFELGQKMIIDAKVIVEKIVDEQVLGDDPQMMVKLQITDLAISESEKSLADNLYINS